MSMTGLESIREGMVVRSADGEKLGRVIAIGAGDFHIEKGLFFPKDYLVSFADVSDVRDGEVILKTGRSALQSTDLGSGPSHGWNEDVAAQTAGHGGATTGYESRPIDRDATTARTTEIEANKEVRVPLAEEQLEVSKRVREAGAVRVRKEVVEETRTIDVPVRKEQVRVEKVMHAGQPIAADEHAFEEEEIVVPVREEEVIISKRPVVTGEVRLSTEAIEEERRVAESLRHEEAHVESEGTAQNFSGTSFRDDDPAKKL
jgi:uncharacterized protein (TIGR02271 family)